MASCTTRIRSTAINGTPLGKPTNTAWGGTYPLSADPLNPWAGIFNWDNGFPTDRYSPAALDRSWGDKNRPGMVDPHYGRSPYIQQWNLNLQRELPLKLVLDVGYIGLKSTGLKNDSLMAINQVPVWALQQYGVKLNNVIRTASDAASYGIAYPYPGFQGTLAAALRQYPQVNGKQHRANLRHTNRIFNVPFVAGNVEPSVRQGSFAVCQLCFFRSRFRTWTAS